MGCDPIAVLTREQVRACDRYAIETLGIPSIVLMENAGRGATEVLLSLGISGRVVICAGKGNNGGDGLVMARHLLNAGVDVRVLLFAWPEELSHESAIHWNIVQHLPIQAKLALDAFDTIQDEFAKSEWIIDALFGTGLQGSVRAPFDRIIASINASSSKIFALDIPTGLDADTGQPLGPTIRSHATATFVAPKLGFSAPTAKEWLGRVHVVDIGIAARYIEASGGR